MGDRAVAERRHEYWFPLVLLGFGLLGLLGWDSVAARDEFGWFAYAPLTSETTVVATVEQSALLTPGAVWAPTSRDWPWAVLITVTLVGTAAWYARRARRAGGSVRPYVALAVGGGLAVPACYVVAGMADALGDPAGLTASVGLPLLGLGVLTGAWAYFRLGPWRRTATAISVACVVTGVATVLGAWSPILLEPVLLAAGLLALAWFERSRLVAAVACVVPVALVVFPDGTLSMLVPAVIVLAAAIAVLVRRNNAGAAELSERVPPP